MNQTMDGKKRTKPLTERGLIMKNNFITPLTLESIKRYEKVVCRMDYTESQIDTILKNETIEKEEGAIWNRYYYYKGEGSRKTLMTTKSL